jgi:hypothetical protein
MGEKSVKMTFILRGPLLGKRATVKKKVAVKKKGDR